MTVFLLFMYSTTSTYQPQPDTGFRPKISVVIPAKNEAGVIQQVVKAVFDSDYPSSRLEVIAVDDGSTDETWDRLQALKRQPRLSSRLVIIRHERNYGKRVALASAVDRATGEIIVCIDSDSFVEPDAIKNLVQPFRDDNVTAVCGHGKASNRNLSLLARLQHYWYAEMFRLWKGMESLYGCVTCCSGILAAYRRSAVQPLLDTWLLERFPNRQAQTDTEEGSFSLTGALTRKLIKSPGEDRVLTAYALSGKGSRTVYQSNAVVETIVPETPKKFFRQQLRWMRSWVHCGILQGRFMWKKPAPVATIFYLYQFLSYLCPAVVIIWLVVKPLQGDWLDAVGFLAGTLYVAALHGLNTWRYLKTSREAVPYRMMFVFIFIILTMTITVYAWATPWKGGWLSREEPQSQPATVPFPTQTPDLSA